MDDANETVEVRFTGWTKGHTPGEVAMIPRDDAKRYIRAGVAELASEPVEEPPPPAAPPPDQDDADDALDAT